MQVTQSHKVAVEHHDLRRGNKTDKVWLAVKTSAGAVAVIAAYFATIAVLMLPVLDAARIA